MTPDEQAEYMRRREAREARRREIDEAAGIRTATTRSKRGGSGAKRRRRRFESWSTRDAYGNTVIRPWRRNNSGGWSRN